VQLHLLMAGVSILAANIAALYIESFLYGIFFILSLTSIYLILKYDGDKDPTISLRPISILQKPILLGTIILFLIITTVGISVTSISNCSLEPGQHWILTFVRFFQGFIYFRGGSAPKVFFNSDIETTEIVQIGFFLAGLIVSDIMFVSCCLFST
jgi:hypothetical protein